MDTMKLLLGATVALLLGALAVSWQGMKTGVKNTSSDELARLEKQVKELRDELRVEKQLQTIRTPIESASSEFEAMKDLLQKNKQAVEELARKKEEEAREARKLEDAEQLLIEKRDLGKKDPEYRRAELISQALLMGKVKDFVPDAALGDFITFDVLMPEQIQVGTIVAIRRKTGILGQLKVSDVSAEGAVANPLPGFGPVKPVPGDELILPPQY